MINEIFDYMKEAPLILQMGYGSIIVGLLGSIITYRKAKKEGDEILLQRIQEEQRREATKPISVSDYNTIDQTLKE